MIPLYQALAQIAADLEQKRIPWALVGGLALAVHAEPRQTKDVDCAISVSSEKDAERLILELHQRGYWDYPDGALMEGPKTGRLQGVRLLPPGEPTDRVVIDILCRMCGIEKEIVEAAIPTEILSGLVVPVATRGHLMAMKVVAWRPKDQEDVRVLLQTANAQDVRDTREALDLIERRPSPDREFEPGDSLDGRFQGLLDEAQKGRQ